MRRVHMNVCSLGFHALEIKLLLFSSNGSAV